jgi:hypothetical protein
MLNRRRPVASKNLAREYDYTAQRHRRRVAGCELGVGRLVPSPFRRTSPRKAASAVICSCAMSLFSCRISLIATRAGIATSSFLYRFAWSDHGASRAKSLLIRSKAPFPGFVESTLASSIHKVPSGERWIHEVRFDGYSV